MKSALAAALFLFAAPGLMGQANPVPLIYQPLHPATVEPGHDSFTLTVHGTGFVSGAVILADLTALPTSFVSSSELRTRIPARYVARPHTAAITVKNPGTIASNVVYFTVRDSSPTVHMTVGGHVTPPGGGAVVAADFNNDGKVDIAVGQNNQDGTGWTITLYEGRGDGTFRAPIKTVLSNAWEQANWFYGMIAADLNGDGRIDLVPFSVSDCYDCHFTTVLLNNGDGTFTDTANFQDKHNFFTNFADLNGDGILDTVEVDNTNDGFFSWAVLLGNGDGTFRRVGAVPAGDDQLISVGLANFADFDGDGNIDVAMAGMANKFQPHPVMAVFLGNGDGTLRPPQLYDIPYGGFQVLIGDMNGDGKLDLIGDDGCVLLGDGDGTFSSGGSCNEIRTTYPAVLADFNGDGNLDFADMMVFDYLDVLLGNSDGSFQQPIQFPIRNPRGNFFNSGNPLADFNNDGLLDLVEPGYRVILALQTP